MHKCKCNTFPGEKLSLFYMIVLCWLISKTEAYGAVYSSVVIWMHSVFVALVNIEVHALKRWFQCDDAWWAVLGKVLLKVMHYNIVFLHKIVTNYALLLFREINALVLSPSLVCLFIFSNKKPRSYIFGDCKCPFALNVKLISLSLKEVLLRLSMGTGEVLVNKRENKITCVSYLKK